MRKIINILILYIASTIPKMIRLIIEKRILSVDVVKKDSIR